MEKILKPYTIIPKHLYVNRNADRQISDIISDMGRPGYVLVSRQMGKTNLLLNAKRTLSNASDKFIYVDLSNVFDDELSCFQNIIDLAIETNDDYFDASEIIFKSRKELNNFPPHKQHLNELRTLLKFTKGKLVIILDEIDALTKTSYSDKIFAQIRSIYFSRDNFPELERLTYILSGVVEPTEIIKDPKISPFNIGEKIFLNDFSKNEFLSFLKSAKLDDLEQEVIERIFYWTNGNPRITWDVCSEIENNRDNIKLEFEVDEIIQRMYLTSFDKPPVDNIREMVISDKKIRDAIIEIDYNKGREVADNIKSKLYLAGIINYEENNIKIKNRIIKTSLNINWLNSLKEQEKGLLKIASELFDLNKFIEAIEVYEKFIENNEFPDKESESFSYYYMGIAYYRNSQFQKAIEILSKCQFAVNELPKFLFRVKHFIGLCYYFLEEYEKSIVFFKYIIDNSSKDELYGRALINYCAASINSNSEILKIEAIQIFKELNVEDKFDSNYISEIEIDEIKSIANFNLGLLLQENEFDSKHYFLKALETKKIELKPIFYYNLLGTLKSIDEQKSLVIELVDCIIENNILPIEIDPEKPLYLNNEKLKEILIKIFKIDLEYFNKLLNFSLNKVFIGELKIKVIYDLAIICLNKKDRNVGIEILKYNYEIHYTIIINNRNSIGYKNLKLLSYYIRSKDNSKYSKEYLECLKDRRLSEIDFYDFDIVSHFVIELMNQGDYKNANDYIILFNKIIHEVPNHLLVNYLLLIHLQIHIQLNLNNLIGVVILCSLVLNDINNKKYKIEKSNLLAEKEIQDIKNNAEDILKNYSKN